MTLSPKLGVVEIITLWHFRLPLLIQMFIKVASSPRLSGIGMPSPILWSHLLKMQRIVLLSSLLWWELGTNSLITGPGEWLSLRRFTSKLSWSWSWYSISCELICGFRSNFIYALILHWYWQDVNLDDSTISFINFQKSYGPWLSKFRLCLISCELNDGFRSNFVNALIWTKSR